MDALQAYRPFHDELFRLYLLEYHLRFTEFFKQFWDRKRKKFASQQILVYLNLAYNQDEITRQYQMEDPRYQNSFSTLVSTFCVNVFNNTMPMVLEVLERMKESYDLEEMGTSRSFAPIDLFKLLNEILDAYKHCPQNEVAKALLGLIFK